MASSACAAVSAPYLAIITPAHHQRAMLLAALRLLAALLTAVAALRSSGSSTQKGATTAHRVLLRERGQFGASPLVRNGLHKAATEVACQGA